MLGLAALNSILPVGLRPGVWPWSLWSLGIDRFNRWAASLNLQGEGRDWTLHSALDAGTMLSITESQEQHVMTQGGFPMSGTKEYVLNKLPALGILSSPIRVRCMELFSKEYCTSSPQLAILGSRIQHSLTLTSSSPLTLLPITVLLLFWLGILSIFSDWGFPSGFTFVSPVQYDHQVSGDNLFFCFQKLSHDTSHSSDSLLHSFWVDSGKWINYSLI